MSDYYRRGLTHTTRVGFLFDTQAIIDEVNKIHPEMMAVGQEIRDMVYQPGGWILKPGITEDSKIYKWYSTIWTPFMQDWLKFREGHQHWYDNTDWKTWDQTQSYRARLTDLRNAAKANLDVQFAGPTPTPPAPPTDFSSIKKLALWGGGALIAAAVYKMVR